MQLVDLVFHGLFPSGPQQPGQSQQRLATVLFDACYQQQNHSHLTAELYFLTHSNELEIRHSLPFDSPEFASAVAQYYQYILGPQSHNVSHSGPKGSSVTGEDVIRAEWHVTIEVPTAQWLEKGALPPETNNVR